MNKGVNSILGNRYEGDCQGLAAETLRTEGQDFFPVLRIYVLHGSKRGNGESRLS